MKKMLIALVLVTGVANASEISFKEFSLFYERLNNQKTLRVGDCWSANRVTSGKGKITDNTTEYWKVLDVYGSKVLLLSLRTYMSDTGEPKSIKTSYEVERNDIELFITKKKSINFENTRTAKEAYEYIINGESAYQLVLQNDMNDSVFGDYKLMKTMKTDKNISRSTISYIDYKMPKELKQSYYQNIHRDSNTGEVSYNYSLYISMQKKSPIKFSIKDVEINCFVKKGFTLFSIVRCKENI